MKGSKNPANSSVFDPFDDDESKRIVRNWFEENGESFQKYEDELRSYNLQGIGTPEFMYKSADKYILRVLESLKDAGIESPSKVFLHHMTYIKANIKNHSHFVDILFSRIVEDCELIDQLKNPETKKKAYDTLKERGFIR